jgi:hypothetical protein
VANISHLCACKKKITKKVYNGQKKITPASRGLYESMLKRFKFHKLKGWQAIAKPLG